MSDDERASEDDEEPGFWGGALLSLQGRIDARVDGLGEAVKALGSKVGETVSVVKNAITDELEAFQEEQREYLEGLDAADGALYRGPDVPWAGVPALEAELRALAASDATFEDAPAGYELAEGWEALAADLLRGDAGLRAARARLGRMAEGDFWRAYLYRCALARQA
eukprot:CAMPEP_0119275474 /NCGR_PEP_ID=MMETSP1329-20130426/13810_1 /TAXON_ID=114041 /ORGANISM="Genus nov. species nov., Strain RCC1024" /LENGTH=166 /DNA_ID=CAMNT_0007275857 /DNA_START=261 /DNA_END=758 /DNA_ORIENTATION=-